jgi:hypothetical protein
VGGAEKDDYMDDDMDDYMDDNIDDWGRRGDR